MNILMVLTSHDQLGNTGKKTGFWLEEFAAPYYVFKDAGADITVVSPKGGQPPLDPKSDAAVEAAMKPARCAFVRRLPLVVRAISPSSGCAESNHASMPQRQRPGCALLRAIRQHEHTQRRRALSER